MLWAYSQTGDRRLLNMAVKAYENFRDEFKPDGRDLRPCCPGGGRIATACRTWRSRNCRRILYASPGTAAGSSAAANAFRKLDRFHMLPDGVPSSSEFLAGRSPLDSHETCVIADYAWSAATC